MFQVPSMDHEKMWMASEDETSRNLRSINTTPKLRPCYDGYSNYSERTASPHPYCYPMDIPRDVHENYVTKDQDEQMAFNPYYPHSPSMRLIDTREGYYKQFYDDRIPNFQAYNYHLESYRKQIKPNSFMNIIRSDLNPSQTQPNMKNKRKRKMKNQQAQNSFSFTNFIERKGNESFETSVNNIIEEKQAPTPVNEKAMYAEEKYYAKLVQDNETNAEKLYHHIPPMQEKSRNLENLYHQVQQVNDESKNAEKSYPHMSLNEYSPYAMMNEGNMYSGKMNITQTGPLNEKEPSQVNKEQLCINGTVQGFPLQEIPLNQNKANDHTQSITAFLQLYDNIQNINVESNEINTIVPQNTELDDNSTINIYELSSHHMISKTEEMNIAAVNNIANSINATEGIENINNDPESSNTLIYLQLFEGKDEHGKNILIGVPSENETFQANSFPEINAEVVSSADDLEPVDNVVLEKNHDQDQSTILECSSEESLVNVNASVKENETDDEVKIIFFSNLNDFVLEETVKSSDDYFEHKTTDSCLSETKPSCSKQKKATYHQLTASSKINNNLSMNTVSLHFNNNKNQRCQILNNRNKTAERSISPVLKNKNAAKNGKRMKWKNRFLWKSKNMPLVTLRNFYFNKLVTTCLQKRKNSKENKVARRILKSVLRKIGVNLLSSISDLSCDLKTFCKKKKTRKCGDTVSKRKKTTIRQEVFKC